MEQKIRFMQGNEAVAEGAIAAGCRFFAGYPISPSSEIAEFMSSRLPKRGGTFIQMEDEIASIAACIGASLTGVKAMTATSGPGLSLKQENIGFAKMAEVPCVIVDVMRGGPSTGNPTGPSQSDLFALRYGNHGDTASIVLVPSSVRESYDLAVEVFNISELLRIPVFLALDEIIAHSREKVELPDNIRVINRKRPDLPEGAIFNPYEETEDLIPPMINFGEGFRFHVTGLNHDKTGFPTGNPAEIERNCRRIVDKVEKNRHLIERYEELETDDAEILIIAYGSIARSAKRAVLDARESGIKAGLFRPITLYPVPAEIISALSGKAKTIIVPEMNLGQYILEIERLSGRSKIKGINKVNGEPIHPQEILSVIKESL